MGRFELESSRDNNLVLQPDADERYVDDICILDDPEDDRWLLKALFSEGATHDFARRD